MPRLIILLLPAVALIILAIQNRTPVALNFLGGSLPTLPLGLLLAIAVALGALITLVLYGLVGLRRPVESKYKPMGRRVPYPEGPSYSSEPGPSGTGPGDIGPGATGPAVSSVSASSYSPAAPTDAERTDSSASSAFVSDPGLDESAMPPLDLPPQAPQDSPRGNYGAAYEPHSSPDATSDSSLINSLKSALPFTGKKGYNRRPASRPVDNRSVGDNWGELRTTEQINDWEAAKPSVVEEGVGNLLRFGKNATDNVGRIADDIASGWNNPDRASRPSVPQYRAEQGYAEPGYAEPGYAEPAEDDLDRGWEEFDDGYGDLPSAGSVSAGMQPNRKRTYGDSLYGSDRVIAPDDGYDYADPEAAVDEIGPDGVYEADYRVIVPPSKPLDEPLTEEDTDSGYYR